MSERATGGRFYRWRKTPRGRLYHLVSYGRTRAYCGKQTHSWSEYAAALSGERCAACARESARGGHVVDEGGSYRPLSDSHRPLVQHIHAGTWRDGQWRSHPRTFSTTIGFERWAKSRQARGCVVQWRFCDAPDERLYPGGAARKQEARAS